MKSNLLLVLTAAVLVSCGGGGETPKPETPAEPVPEAKPEPVCTYSYNEENTSVQWIAYKYTEKTGVKGTFDEVTVHGTTPSSNPAEVISAAAFEIHTVWVNSGDATRDPKIRESFFGTLEAGEVITGQVVTVSGGDKEGKITFNITMNGSSKEVEGAYTVSGEILEAKVELNMEDWNGGAAIAALNEVCSDLHTGADGSSKLWPDVTVFVTTTLDKACD